MRAFISHLLVGWSRLSRAWRASCRIGGFGASRWPHQLRRMRGGCEPATAADSSARAGWACRDGWISPIVPRRNAWRRRSLTTPGPSSHGYHPLTSTPESRSPPPISPPRLVDESPETSVGARRTPSRAPSGARPKRICVRCRPQCLPVSCLHPVLLGGHRWCLRGTRSSRPDFDMKKQVPRGYLSTSRTRSCQWSRNREVKT